MLVEVAHHGFGNSQFGKLVQHQSNARLDFFVGVEDDVTGRQSQQTNRQCQPQFATRGFVPGTGLQPAFDLVQFRFTHNPG